MFWVFRERGLMCSEGLEPPTSWSVARRSIQLSYEHVRTNERVRKTEGLNEAAPGVLSGPGAAPLLGRCCG